MKYPWMPLFWGDFLANTMHLSAQEAGAYLFLIAHAWEHEGKIPAQHVRLARIAHMRHDRWKPVWQALEDFFEPEAVGPVITGYHHKRVHCELQRLGKISSNRKAAAEQMHRSYGKFAVTSTSTSNGEDLTNGKRDADALVAKPAPNYRDKGVDYRAQPAKKSDNDLADPNRQDLKALETKGKQ
jgi:uncharacterized protein YdaU (DUF1376 family)